MCWFVTIGVPQGSRHLLERAQGEHRFLDFWFTGPTPTTDLFGPGQACAQVSRGGCSCSLVLEPAPDVEDLIEKQRVRLRKKGLGEARIERALQDKASALAGRARAAADTALLNALVASLARASADARLYRHYYSDSQNTAAVPLPATATISLRELESNGFPADTLVTVRGE